MNLILYRSHGAVIISTLLLLLPLAAYGDDCRKAMELVSEGNRLLSYNPERAEGLYSEAVGKCPISANAHYNLGVSLLNQKKYGEAAAAFENALKIKKDSPEAMAGKALALIDGSIDADEGKRLAKMSLSLRPGDKMLTALLKRLEGPDVDDAPVTNIRNPYAIAVVIGNKNYRNRDVPSVDYAVRDASVVRNYLIKTLGYREGNIIFETDASFAKFREIFGTEKKHDGRLYNHIRPGRSDVFVYYSGHGTYDTADPSGKRTYFVPVDASPDAIALNGYPLDLFYGNLSKLKKELRPSKMTVIIDSCFSGGSEGGMLVKGSLMYVEVANPLMTVSDTIVITSAGGSQISSWYPEKRHSLFTYFFLKAIKEKVEEGKGKVAIKDIEGYLKEEVSYYARRLHNGRTQVPQISGDMNILLLER